MWIYERIRRRPLMLIGALIGLVVALLVLRNESRVTKIEKRVVRVEADTPCLNLTSAECALKLFKALPQQARHQLRITSTTLQSLERRAKRERKNLRRTGTDLQPVPGAGPGSPGRSPGGSSPVPGSKRPGSSHGPTTSPPPQGGGSTAPAPVATATPAPTPGPIVKSPGIQTPPVGPIPPINIPPVEVPCPPLAPVVNCN
jgi:hypothetical protein